MRPSKFNKLCASSTINIVSSDKSQPSSGLNILEITSSPDLKVDENTEYLFKFFFITLKSVVPLMSTNI